MSILLNTANFDLSYLIDDLHMTIMPDSDKGISGMGNGVYVLKENEPSQTRHCPPRFGAAAADTAVSLSLCRCFGQVRCGTSFANARRRAAADAPHASGSSASA
ncbi:MAG: hypothetical protein JNL61_12550 [Rhizobiaceae bacterium]|nr:hypothetical protein [Rhizobiaceae bacterium]